MFLASGLAPERTMRILVADPSRTMRNITRAVLAQLGYYDVDEAADSAEASARVRFARFDLCIVDHALQSQDRSGLADTLRAAPFSTGCIILRTQDSLESQPAQREPAPGPTLQKPFAPEALRKCIESLLQARSALPAA